MDEVIGRRLGAVERFAWHADGGAPADLCVGSVHLWFAGGRGLHLDTASDWTLRWSISEPGDDGWLDAYRYRERGRWLVRDASREAPFVDLVGLPLSSAAPKDNEVGEVSGVTLTFGKRVVTLSQWRGEIDTSPR